MKSKFYKCYNYHWGRQVLVEVESEEGIPVKGSPEEALELYKEHLRSSQLGKDHPEYIDDTTVNSTPIIIDDIMVIDGTISSVEFLRDFD